MFIHVPTSWKLGIALLLLFGVSCSKKEENRVLVFSKTTVFRHESIPAGIAAIKALGVKYHFEVDTTENSANFYEENLKRYKAVIFLNTTGDILNQEQQNDFERFIQAGGGYVGIHAATDTEYDWPWYNGLAGAYFESHPNGPNVRDGLFYTVDKNHPSMDSIPDQWKRTDEFYNFQKISPEIKVLINIDEKSYEGGTNGEKHPMSWYHEYDGGRAFYTAMGHTNESFSEPLFLKHLAGGIQYAMNSDQPKPLNYTNVRTKRVPEENRFAKVVLDEKLEEPVELAVLPDNRVLFIERRGNVKLYDPAVQKTTVINKIAVSTKYKFKDGNQAEAEDGLLGLALDPNFEKNHWVYLYYSPAADDPKNILTRYEFRDGKLDEGSMKIILDVATQREQCCHTGGSIAFDAQGNLFLSTGDNTSPRSTAYAPIDERPGRSPWDAQKGSANTNDLRGKVLRIHPEADGTYTIPEGNLFPKGTAKTRPEIYTMGARNPYRISVDKHTGFLYWGDVGPDAGADSVGIGPKAFDEINQARKPGFFGWPYFVGDNRAYHDRDFATRKTGAAYDPDKPINASPNNTGLQELPPAQKAFIWYPYDVSTEFPLMGKGGRTAMAGPVFYSTDFKKAKRAFPDYYDGKLFIYEWMRGWIMAVTMDKEGNYMSMEHFMPSQKFSNPMDMEFGPDGDLYVLEYGTAWFQGNEDARLVRIEYTGGNRKPLVQVAASKTKGAVPMEVSFTSNGTKDFDRDELTYEWKISSADGTVLTTVKEANAKFTFDKIGTYMASLTVTDAKGEKASRDLEIQAGNEPPVLAFDITRGNQTFFFPNQSFDYVVTVSDQEDGTLEKGISGEEVSVRIDYLKEGFDQIEIAQGHVAADAAAAFATGRKLMGESDCKSCHIIDKKSIGPMYIDVAKKYKNDPKAVDYLVTKIINGGGGVWGETNMAAHPQLSVGDATEIVKYILSLGDEQAKSLPARGTYTTTIPKGVPDQGVLILRASYTDKGANGLPSITSSKTMVLQSASVPAGKATVWEGVMKYKIPTPPIELMIGSGNNSYIGFDPVDLTGIDQMAFAIMAPENMMNAAGGWVEVRIDSPTGTVIGKSNAVTPSKGQAMNFTPQIALAQLTPTSGKHAVYFIYKNDQSPAGQALFILLNINFISSGKTFARK
ncbi:MAG: ThuA domain-containing protein [Cyclobacteriaceae bacterium]|nr:ThuA domain-containing protein [Cyclobacteriaceae bacterium]